MENKLELRVGDVVRLKPLTVSAIRDDKDLSFAGMGAWISPNAVESIITRVETPQETIARLEAELGQCKQDCADWEYQAKTKSSSKIEWSGGPNPIRPNSRAIIWQRNGETRLVWPLGCRWEHNQTAHDIIAYMVLPQ